ncbi:MAG: Gldg family protein [Elainellaceae cyanobacterium]
MGLTAGAIAGWGVVPSILVLLGMTLAIAWLVWTGATQKGFWGRRSTQEGTNALLATIAVLIILSLINFLAVRYPARVDLTENKIFTLAPQSQLIAQQLQQPVKVFVFASNPDPVDEELLRNYRRQNNQFSYEYVDPQAQPGVAQQFGVQSFGEVYLESGDNQRFVQTVNAQERLSERRLTNALLQLTNTSQQKAYFLQGHGERAFEEGQGGFAQARTALEEEGYGIEPLNLAENPEVPEDANVLVVAGPQQPLLEAEVQALEEYLTRKSGLLLLIDPQTDPNTAQNDFGLNPLLQDWGIRLSDRIVIDPAGQASGLGPGVTIVNQYGEHPITRGFNGGISFYPLARPLETASVTDVETTQLLVTSDRTEAHRLGNSGELEFDPATDPTGPFNIGLALSRSINAADASEAEAASPEPSPSPDAEEPAEESTENSDTQARLVVIGNASFAGNGLFEQQLNGDVFLNSVSWLSQQDDELLSIRPREVTNRRIVMSPEQQTTVSLIAVAFLPILGFAAAALVWWRRR